MKFKNPQLIGFLFTALAAFLLIHTGHPGWLLGLTSAWVASCKLEMVQGIHLAADTYKMALFTNAATLNKTTTAYSTSNEVSGTGYTAGGVTMVGYTAATLTSTSVAIAITRSGAVATVTQTAHGFINGQTVTISGATQGDYNIAVNITVVDANTYTYPVANAPATPATGSPVVSYTAATLDFTTDPSWTSATITARYAVIYNSTRSNKAVAVIDFGSDITSTNGTFTVQLPVPAAETAVLRWF